MPSVSGYEGYTDNDEYFNTYSDLRDIPRDIPAQAQKVFLYWNEISYIRAGALEQLSECTELDLRVNKLNKVRSSSIGWVIIEGFRKKWSHSRLCPDQKL